MKTIFLIIIQFAIFIAIPLLSKSENIYRYNSDTCIVSNSKYINITIITPTTEVYDDGVFRNLFTGYSIFDTNNELLVQIAPSIDIPVILKIKEGVYFIKKQHNTNKIFQITIASNLSNVFIIE